MELAQWVYWCDDKGDFSTFLAPIGSNFVQIETTQIHPIGDPVEVEGLLYPMLYASSSPTHTSAPFTGCYYELSFECLLENQKPLLHDKSPLLQMALMGEVLGILANLAEALDIYPVFLKTASTSRCELALQFNQNPQQTQLKRAVVLIAASTKLLAHARGFEIVGFSLSNLHTSTSLDGFLREGRLNNDA